MEDVVTSYTDLTGKPELPPLWALGIIQNGVIIQSNVKEITAKFRELKIPAMPFIWILITWKGLDVLHGTRNIFLIQKEWLQN
jgi:alpha-glucosidase (family GH31 glycosyl hydrolase)